MRHDFSKPTHLNSSEDIEQKKRVPIYILLLVGMFLVAMLIYMLANWF